MKYLIKAKQVFLENEILNNSSVLVENGKIININTEDSTAEVIDLTSYRLLPGLIDIHTHGGNNVEANDATKEAIDTLARHKITQGVTSFCPTTTTAPMDLIKKALTVIADAKKNGTGGAKVLGSYVEGPYICKKYKGAHPKEYIRELTTDEIQQLIDASSGTILVFIVAPELNGAMDAISFLRKNNIVPTIGHTNATYQEVNKAVLLGASLATHAYNAMRPLTHRDPGTVGALMTNDNIYCEVIFDNVHIDSAAVEVLLRCKGTKKVILITDEMRAGGLSDGDYYLGELKTIVKNKIARTLDGALAGSTLFLNTAVHNMIKILNVSAIDAVNMASINPATALGLQNEIGSIAVSKCADLIAVDDNFQVIFAMVGGKPVIQTS